MCAVVVAGDVMVVTVGGAGGYKSWFFRFVG